MNNAGLLTAAARLLVEIAGPAPQHIEMSRRGPKKYYTVARALTLNDARQHLRGIKTRGALCSHPGDQARALAYDADDQQHWELLRQAARQLAAAGYRPLLEPSPRGRGGHLWLLFTALVDAQAARQHAHSIAPELTSITEYWPGPPGVTGWNRIRLPGGRYIAPGLSAWCKLYDADGQELARDGISAARVLLDYQTPAELVPTLPLPDQQSVSDPWPAVTPARPARQSDMELHITTRQEPEQPQDQGEREKRNRPALRNAAPGPASANRFLWFRYSAAQLAEWFNERHTLEELHPREPGPRGGMAYSPSVSERTPSTGYHDTPGGERWTDFSARARRSDGRPDGGDALELYIRLRSGSKAAILRELGREMVSEARAELEAAARSGVQPRALVEQITTAAGWEHYRELAQAQHTRQQEQAPKQDDSLQVKRHAQPPT